MIRPDYLIGTKNEVFGPGGIQNAVVETLVRTEGPIDAKLVDKSINENGTYSASAEGADGFKKVTVDVPNTYLLSDEGKVVSGGSLVTQTSSTVTENGVVDTTLIDSVTVSVSGSGGDFNAKILATSTTFDYRSSENSPIVGISIPDGVTTIASSCFEYAPDLITVVIPDSVTKIGDKAFYEQSNLININTLNNVTTIGNQAFAHCSSLTSVNIPNVTTIGGGAFADCSSLTSINIPNVTTIGNQAFIHCSSLTSVNVSNVTTIGTEAFDSCENLSSFNIPSTVTTIGASAFLYCPLSSIIIPSSVTEIGEEAFLGCHASEVTIPGSVTEVSQIFTEGWAGTVNEYINNLVFEEGVQTIGYFADLTNLSTLSIPSTVDTIDEYSFGNCGSNSEQLIITINQNEATSPIAEYAPWGASNAQVIWVG